MANRLSTITTRTGDDGTTGLGDGTRVAKIDRRIHALGDVDELNSTLGVLLAEPLPDPIRRLLIEVQHDLFDLGESCRHRAMSCCERRVPSISTAQLNH